MIVVKAVSPGHRLISLCPNVTPLRIPNPLRVRNTEEALVLLSYVLILQKYNVPVFSS